MKSKNDYLNCAPLKERNEDKHNSFIEKDKGPKIVKLFEKNSLKFHDNKNVIVNSNKDDNNVPKLKMNFNKKSILGCGKFARDSEDDSGVYFTDSTKVSPVKVKSDSDSEQSCSIISYMCNMPEPYNKCLTSDTVDNKETNLGPPKNLDSSISLNSFFSVLDSFEAETLNTFKENMFSSCGINFNEQTGKPGVSESLNQYLQDLLNNSCINEVDDTSVPSIDDCGLAKPSDNVTVGSKVHEETASKKCNTILPSVCSFSLNDVDSDIDVDYSSTNLGFVVKCSGTDFLNNIKTNDVNNLTNESSVTNSEVGVTHLDYESPNCNDNSDKNYSDDNLFFKRITENSVISISSSLNNLSDSDNCISVESTDYDKGEVHVENDFSDENVDELVLNTYRNKVKSLISFFENIVNVNNIIPEKEKGLCDDEIIKPNFNFLNSNDNIINAQIYSSNDITEVNDKHKLKKGVKCVSFSEDLIYINIGECPENHSSLSLENCTEKNSEEINDHEIVFEHNTEGQTLSFPADDVNEEFRNYSPVIKPPTGWEPLQSELDSTEITGNVIQSHVLTDLENFDEVFLGLNNFSSSVEEVASSVVSKTCSAEFEDNVERKSTFSDPSGQQLATQNDLCSAKYILEDEYIFHRTNNMQSAIVLSCDNKEDIDQNICGVDAIAERCCVEQTCKTLENFEGEVISGCHEKQSGENDPERYEVILEKLWGSIGIKLEEATGTGELVISDILPGCAAEINGFIRLAYLFLWKLLRVSEIVKI